MEAIRFKIHYNEDLHVLTHGNLSSFENVLTFNSLQNEVQSIFFSTEESKKSDFRITYSDNDGDFITLGSDRDFEEMMSYIESEKMKSINLHVIKAHPNNATTPKDIVKSTVKSAKDVTASLAVPKVVDFIKQSLQIVTMNDICVTLQAEISKTWIPKTPTEENTKTLIINWLSFSSFQQDLSEMESHYALIQETRRLVADGKSNNTSVLELLLVWMGEHQQETTHFLNEFRYLNHDIGIVLDSFIPILLPYALKKKEEKVSSVIHEGICCDGCSTNNIQGNRYQSTQEPAVDFCTTCEASGEYDEFGPFIVWKNVQIADEEDDGVKHLGVVCDGCDVHPICGNRFKSATAVDFDLCSTCEASGQWNTSHGPFLKITNPSQCPKVLIFGIDTDNVRNCAKEESLSPVLSTEPVCVEQRLNARYVSDANYQDKSTVRGGSVIKKSWVLANEGNVAWPAGCYLTRVGGQCNGVYAELNDSTTIVPALAASQQCVVSLEIVIPKAPGRFVSYYRLSKPDGTHFGQRFWIDVMVKEEEGSSGGATVSFASVEPEVYAVAQSSEESALKPEYYEAMDQLVAMGFTDVQMNTTLLNECNGNVDDVLIRLL